MQYKCSNQLWLRELAFPCEEGTLYTLYKFIYGRKSLNAPSAVRLLFALRPTRNDAVELTYGFRS